MVVVVEYIYSVKVNAVYRSMRREFLMLGDGEMIVAVYRGRHSATAAVYLLLDSSCPETPL